MFLEYYALSQKLESSCSHFKTSASSQHIALVWISQKSMLFVLPVITNLHFLQLLCWVTCLHGYWANNNILPYKIICEFSSELCVKVNKWYVVFIFIVLTFNFLGNSYFSGLYASYPLDIYAGSYFCPSEMYLQTHKKVMASSYI